jgi:hypothetical protein
MHRSSVTFPAYLAGAMCGAAAICVDKGHPIAAGVCFLIVIALLFIADRAFDAWIETWEAMLGIRK